MSQQSNLYANHLQSVQGSYLRAAKAEGKSGVLIASGSLKYTFLDDHSYPFVVNPHFKAFLPVTDVPDSFILLRESEKPLLLFHQPEDYWHMTPETPTGYWVDQWDITPIANITDAHNHLGDPSELAFIGEEVELAQNWSITHCNEEAILNPVHFSRAYKTDYEIDCLRQANQLAAIGHAAAFEAFQKKESEFGIQQAYLGAIGHREKETPYSNIVALNQHCAVLHYQFYDRTPPTPVRSMLIDAGASYQGYASDVTRTYALESGLFKDLVDAMDTAQRSLISEIEVGMSYVTLHENMHRKLGEILSEFKLVNMSVDGMLETNLTFTFLPHGLGHFLGLQTHDVGGFQQTPEGEHKAAPEKYPALRLTRPIENQQVFTIEPGLYFIPMLLNQLKQSDQGKDVNWTEIDNLLPFGGIRIEDNVVIQNEHVVNLTREAFSL